MVATLLGEKASQSPRFMTKLEICSKYEQKIYIER